MEGWIRTHTCGELRANYLDKKVTLNGWVHSRRDHGGLIFIDLRDRYGFTQVTFDPAVSKDAHKLAEQLRREFVIAIRGTVKKRKPGMANPKLETGEVEVFADEINIINAAETPPIEIDDRIEISEDMRLKYRYLDLRKPVMQKNLRIRHKVAKSVRDFFDAEGFLEVETPMLAKSTPEGARDYVVPSRVHPGSFFALPQSPQLFKQLLMVSGCDRYFQIVKCFRDEDLRADRQPEFTQIDIEMSFITQDMFLEVMERLTRHIFKESIGVELESPFPRLTYEEAMDRYGSDKPDVRFGLELVNATDIFGDCGFETFVNITKIGGSIKCINAKDCAKFSRKEIDDLINHVQIYDAKGLAWMKMIDGKLESSIVKFFSADIQNKIIERTQACDGDLLLFVADHKRHVVETSLGQLRIFLGKKLGLMKDDEYKVTWVVDFPLVEYDEDRRRHVAIHHPFTSPKIEDIPLLDSEPTKVRSNAYDLAINGVEIAGGSIRIHQREVQEKMFSILGISPEEAQEKFGFLLGAFRYGAPPHGGIAFGFDRLCAMLSGNESIREVIAFPKNKAAQSLMDDCPSEISEEQLKELHIKLSDIALGKNAVFDKIRDLLDNKGAEYGVKEHKAVYTSQAAAEVRGTDKSQGMKSLILKIDGLKHIMAIVPGDKELDIDKLKEIVKGTNVDFARAEEVKNVSGCSIGAVPPFGNLFNIPVYVDSAVKNNEKIAFNAGSHKKSIIMKLQDYLDIVKPEMVDIGK